MLSNNKTNRMISTNSKRDLAENQYLEMKLMRVDDEF